MMSTSRLTHYDVRQQIDQLSISLGKLISRVEQAEAEKLLWARRRQGSQKPPAASTLPKAYVQRPLSLRLKHWLKTNFMCWWKSAHTGDLMEVRRGVTLAQARCRRCHRLLLVNISEGTCVRWTAEHEIFATQNGW